MWACGPPRRRAGARLVAATSVLNSSLAVARSGTPVTSAAAAVVASFSTTNNRFARANKVTKLRKYEGPRDPFERYVRKHGIEDFSMDDRGHLQPVDFELPPPGTPSILDQLRPENANEMEDSDFAVLRRKIGLGDEASSAVKHAAAAAQARAQAGVAVDADNDGQIVDSRSSSNQLEAVAEVQDEEDEVEEEDEVDEDEVDDDEELDEEERKARMAMLDPFGDGQDEASFREYLDRPLEKPPTFDEVSNQIDSLMQIQIRDRPMFPAYMRARLKVACLQHIKDTLKDLMKRGEPLTLHTLHSHLFSHLIRIASRLAKTEDERITILCPEAPALGEKVPHPQWPELTTVVKRFFTNSSVPSAPHLFFSENAERSDVTFDEDKDALIDADGNVVEWSEGPLGEIHQLAVVYRFDTNGSEFEIRYPLTRKDVQRLRLFQNDEQGPIGFFSSDDIGVEQVLLVGEDGEILGADPNAKEEAGEEVVVPELRRRAGKTKTKSEEEEDVQASGKGELRRRKSDVRR